LIKADLSLQQQKGWGGFKDPDEIVVGWNWVLISLQFQLE
jgi:hypothetical protein